MPQKKNSVSRSNSTVKSDKTADSAKDENASVTVTSRKNQIEAWADKAHPKIKQVLKDNAMLLAKCVVFVEEKIIPQIIMLWHFMFKCWQKLEPHLHGENMNDIVPAVCGVCLCFFGGTFPLLIAAVEAFRLGGYGDMKIALVELLEEAQKALEANRVEEEKAKAEGDKTLDEMTPNEIVMKKGMLCLRVVNPEKVTDALAHLNVGLLAVLASLKLQFARAITLGATLAKIVKKQVDRRVKPMIVSQTPEDYQKWVGPVLDYTIKLITVSLAMWIQSIISAFHSALRGGHMAGKGVIRFLHRQGKINFDEDDSLLDEAMGYGLAAAGFLWQFTSGFHTPFPFWILLLPVTTVEYMLSMAMALV